MRVAEPPEQPEAALEERPGAIDVSGDHEVDREPVERPRDSHLVAEAFVDGEGLSKERLRLRRSLRVSSGPARVRVRLRDALGVVERARELECFPAELLGTVVVALVVREDAVAAQRAGAGRRCLG